MPYEKALELFFQIILQGMQDCPPDIKVKNWERWMTFLEKSDANWVKIAAFLHLENPPALPR